MRFFHNNAFGSEIEDPSFFYLGPFSVSPAAALLTQRCGTPINFSTPTVSRSATSRLVQPGNRQAARPGRPDAVQPIPRHARRRGDQAAATGRERDSTAPYSCSAATGHPALLPGVGRTHQPRETEIETAITSPASSRGGHISNAVSRIENARGPIGANITFNRGQGNLVF